MFTNQDSLSDWHRKAVVDHEGHARIDAGANRLIARRSFAYFLKSVVFSCGKLKGLSHLDFLLALAIWNANSRPSLADMRAAHRLCFEGIAPDAAAGRIGISRSSMSRMLNIPLETVRRRVAILIRKGIAADSPTGLVCTGCRDSYEGDFAAVERNNADALAAMVNRLAESGIALPASPWIEVENGRPADRARTEWHAAVTLFSTDYQVLMLSELLSVFRVRFVHILILLTVLLHNIGHLLEETGNQSVFQILPDALRRGVPRKRVEHDLAMPNETVRRQIIALLAKNLLIEREDGLVVPGIVIARYIDQSQLAAHNTRYVMAMLTRLQALADYRASLGTR